MPSARPRLPALACLTLGAALALAGCPTPPTPGTVRGEIGAAGGALSLEGAVLVVPPGAVSTPTRFSITLLSEGPPVPAERRLSALWRFEPDEIELAVPARVTLPTTGFSSAPMARWARPGSTTDFEDIEPLFSSAAAVTNERTRLGRAFVESRGTTVRDAGPRDAPVRDAPARDAPSVDAPRLDAGPPPTPPVTVGVDLRPADFSCRGTRTAPPLGGAPAPSPILVVEYLDGGGRASFHSSRDALGAIGSGSTDSTGMGDTVARDGAWTTLDFDFTSGASDALTIPTQSLHFLSFDPTSTTRVEVLSQRTWSVMATALSPFGDLRGVLVGTVTDCDGAAVGRARIRVFVGSTELDPLAGSFAAGYSSGSTRVPTPGTTRTSADGAFFAVGALDPSTGLPTTVRVEVWGALTLGAPEERLGCEEVPSRDDGPVSLSIGPERADASGGCS